MSNEALATTKRRLGRRVGDPAAARTRFTGCRPRTAAATTVPTGHVLEFHHGCMRIPATPALYIDPWLPVYVPDVVDVDLDVDIPVPGPPGIGAPGRPNIGAPGPGLAPRNRWGRGGGRGGRR